MSFCGWSEFPVLLLLFRAPVAGQIDASAVLLPHWLISLLRIFKMINQECHGQADLSPVQIFTNHFLPYFKFSEVTRHPEEQLLIG